MLAAQRETGARMVESRPFPGRCRMTLRAVRPVGAFVHIVLAMTGIAVLWQLHAVRGRHVTGRTLDRLMPACKRKAGPVMIEMR